MSLSKDFFKTVKEFQKQNEINEFLKNTPITINSSIDFDFDKALKSKSTINRTQILALNINQSNEEYGLDVVTKLNP